MMSSELNVLEKVKRTKEIFLSMFKEDGIPVEDLKKAICESYQEQGFDCKTFDDIPLKEMEEAICDCCEAAGLKFDNFDDKRIYVKNIINEIYEKDVKPNKKIRNKHLFEQIKTYIINNFGATTSVNSLCDYLKKINGSKPTKNTIYNYLEILEKVKIISKCKRFDLKSKKSLNGDEKYYLTDLSFYFSLQTDNRINYGPVLENIVFNYSQMCGYTASIGKIGNLEIDFILRNELTNDYAYVQVAKTIDNGIYNDEGKLVTEEREYAPLEKIKDGYPKYLLTLDKILQKRSGVKHCNIIDFIVNNEKF